jgi:hypothetical protein
MPPRKRKYIPLDRDWNASMSAASKKQQDISDLRKAKVYENYFKTTNESTQRTLDKFSGVRKPREAPKDTPMKIYAARRRNQSFAKKY